MTDLAVSNRGTFIGMATNVDSILEIEIGENCISTKTSKAYLKELFICFFEINKLYKRSLPLSPKFLKDLLHSDDLVVRSVVPGQ